MNILHAPASLLAQVNPTTASAVLAYSATLQTEVTHMLVTNTASATARWSLFHDDTGTAYSEGCALWWDVDINGNSTFDFMARQPGTGITLRRGGTLGVRSDKTAGVTFSIYGVTQQAR